MPSALAVTEAQREALRAARRTTTTAFLVALLNGDAAARRELARHWPGNDLKAPRLYRMRVDEHVLARLREHIPDDQRGVRKLDSATAGITACLDSP